jgi:hypothetical protein
MVKRTLDYIEKNSDLRKEADELIVRVWNEIEDTHNKLPEETRQAANEKYGIVYFYRKNELNNVSEAPEAQSSTWP